MGSRPLALLVQLPTAMARPRVQIGYRIKSHPALSSPHRHL